jgi:riboflavin kinase/FMN adenylyltransferase
VVSSSGIRELIRTGGVSLATRFLQHAYAIEGCVVSGRGIGSKQTVPTLNLATAAEVIPALGVYVTRTRDLETGREWDSVTNIGYRPTFEASDQLSIETFLLDTVAPGPEGTPLPPVGCRLRVEFLWRVRDERQFDSPAALKAQILKDAGTAQRYLRRAKAWIGRPERRCP